MKTIRYLFYMILILSNIGVLRGDFSIAPFLNYLQETGYYDIILSVKLYFGDDVAIDVCKELVQSKDCEIMVKVYITGDKIPIPSIDIQIYKQILEYLEKYDITDEMRDLIIVILSFYDSLIKNMNKEEIIDFIKRIIKNQ